MDRARLCLITVTTASILVFWLYQDWYFLSQDVFCTLPACEQVASEILQDLHPDYKTIDPCDDFYNLVCGGFEERYKQESEYVNQLTLVHRQMLNTLHHVFEQEPSEMKLEYRRIFAKMKASYDSCMDLQMLEQLGLKPLEEIVNTIKSLSSTESSGVADSLGPTGFSLPQVEIYNALTMTFLFLLKSGLRTLVDLDIVSDDKAPETEIVSVWPLFWTGLPSSWYYSDRKTVKAYKDVIEHVLANFYSGGNLQGFNQLSGHQELTASLADGIIYFETRVAEALPPISELFSSDPKQTYNKMDLREVEKLLPELSIPSIMQALSPKGLHGRSIIVRSPRFIRQLSKILSSTPSRILEGFFIWKAVQEYSSRIEHPILDPLKQFQNKLSGIPQNSTKDRWKHCVLDTVEEMPWIVSKFYVQEKFSHETKIFAGHIIDDITNKFAEVLKSATWMTIEDRRVARKKAHSVLPRVGYPTSNPNVLDSHSLESYYSGLNISSATYAENKARAGLFNTNLEWSKLGKPTRREDFGMRSLMITANYVPNQNKIGFPAAYLQPPLLFDPVVPAYLSYGALGAVAGHELSHGFDPAGSQYDYDGKLRNWWSDNTREAFNDKAACFVDQYSNYSVPYSHGKYQVNGSLTLGENIADAGGVHAAFSAWGRREKANPAALLRGLEHFTKEQLFFVAYGRNWCSKSTGEELYRRMLANAHAPEQLRLQGTMENSAEFKNAFQCEERQPICKLW